MRERKERINLLQIVCLVSGLVLMLSLARGFGYRSFLAKAVAGAIGALLGTVIYRLIVLRR